MYITKSICIIYVWFRFLALLAYVLPEGGLQNLEPETGCNKNYLNRIMRFG